MIGILSFITGGIIANATHTKTSIPLGIIMMDFPYALMFIWFIILISEHNYKSTKKILIREILGYIIPTIIFAYIILSSLNNVYFGCKHLIIGPDEAVISNVSILKEKSNRIIRYKAKSVYEYYLVGYINEDKKKILIRGDKMRSLIEGKIKDSKILKIHYHENLNIAYEAN